MGTFSIEYRSMVTRVIGSIALMAMVTIATVAEPGAQQGLENGLGVEMVEIPAGRFTMGSPDPSFGWPKPESWRYNDERMHGVVIGRPFLAARHEVTQGLWKRVMGKNPSTFNRFGDDCPVHNVTWYDAVKFCNEVSGLEGLGPAYRIEGENITWDPEAKGYRLPTEAEWEYACRAGTVTMYYTGESKSDLKRAGWYKDNAHGDPKSVGKKAPNAWGLYDMHGNVWEWCWDRYSEEYPRGEVRDPVGPASGTDRVLRGGSYDDLAYHCRSALRCNSSPNDHNTFIGLRLFRSK